eukprot:TRINITY_DN480_c0_g1_i1.p2 TRINITY_DN480_c0_g1~~TRINITY_DN480_c0_g1_i1.p2  ORF type:complete len:823 (-),score=89.53 TRINITY_DN480_c0_g1_i1:4376-6844(-)
MQPRRSLESQAISSSQLVTNARSFLFYANIAALICALSLLWLIDLRVVLFNYPLTLQEVITLRQRIRLISILGFLLLAWLYRSHHETVARTMLSAAGSTYGWTLIFLENDLITGPATIACGNFAVIPVNYLFDKKAQVHAYFLSGIGNVVLWLIYEFFYAPTYDLVITREIAKTRMTSCVILLVGTSIFWIYFSRATSKIFVEMRESQEKMEQAAQEKSVFFSALSHEIRNPLQSLLASLELIQEKHKMPSPTFSHLLAICKTCCETVLSLVSGILDMSKIAADKMLLSVGPIDLKEVINKVLRILSPKAQVKGIELKVINDPQLPPAVELDALRTEQVLMNLVSNAVKFTSKGQVVIKVSWFPMLGSVSQEAIIAKALDKSSWKKVMVFNEKQDEENEVFSLPKKYIKEYKPSHTAKELPARTGSRSHHQLETEPLGKGVVKIEVMDSGIGVSKDTLGLLFKPYQQANAGITKDYGGTGLGLWIIKNIINMMKGEIKAIGKEGRGSNFMLAIPTEASLEVPQFTNSFGEGPKSVILQGRTCLLLDNLIDNTYVIKELLDHYGVNAVCFQKAEAALDAYKGPQRIDMVVTDLRMHSMSGQAFIREVRKFEEATKRRRVPIVVLTAESSVEERKQCILQYGANEYLVKPIKCEDFMAALERTYLNNKLVLNRNILLVDDDLISTKFISTLLNSRGYLCKVCNSVKDARREFEENYKLYSIILLDNLLGDGTGIDFFVFAEEKVKKEDAKMPLVISISGNSVQDQKEFYQGCGVKIFLQKPIKKQDLMDLLQVLQIKRQTTNYKPYVWSVKEQMQCKVQTICMK